ncbi:hypothetical protein LTS10_012269 [Elasticomyces elasticus]|nr:hypothetical protein LTS10_012269 [Elasticomyces elasticus]
MAPNYQKKARLAAAAHKRAELVASVCDFKPEQKEDPSKLSILLDLPPELRTCIFDIILAQGGGVRLPRKTSSHQDLVVPSTMLLLNKQVYDEFMHAAWVLADIHTNVANYDFRHIVTFMNKLSDEEVRRLPNIKLPQQRSVIITLDVNWWAGVLDGDVELLRRWLNRAKHPTKRGTEVRYEYRLAHAMFTDPRAAEWERQASLMPEGRKKEELMKIVDALHGRASAL